MEFIKVDRKKWSLAERVVLFVIFEALLICSPVVLMGEKGLYVAIALSIALVGFLLWRTNFLYALFLISVVITNHYQPWIGTGATIRERNILFCLAMAACIVHLAFTNRYKFKRHIPAEYYGLLGIMAIALICGIISDNRAGFIRQDAMWAMFILSYFPFAVLFAISQSRLWCAVLMMVATVGSSLEAIIRYFRTHGRAVSNAELFLPVVIILSISMYFLSNLGPRKRTWLIPVFFITLLAVFVSLTRSLWISLAVGLVIIGITVARKYQTSMLKYGGKKLFGWAVLAMISVAIIFLVDPKLWNMVGRRFNMIFMGSYDFSTLYRIIEYIKEVDFIRQYPLFGQGFGATIFMPFQHTTELRIGFGTPYVHNTFMYWLLKFGIIGSLMWYVLWFRLLRKITRIIRAERDELLKSIQVGLIVGLITVAVFSTMAPVLSASTGYFFMAFLLAFFFPLGIRESKGSNAEDSGQMCTLNP